MTRVVAIESKLGNIEGLQLKEDIRWSSAVYGWSLLDKVRKVIASILRINSKFDSHPFDLFLKEAHHQSYGRPWVTGKYQLDFMKSIGLEANHKLLDFGCGSGRFGVRAIKYLECSNYYGLDFHLPSLQAFSKYEIVLNDLIEKNPRLLKDDDFNFSYFGEKLDWIMDFYVSHHLNDCDFERISKNASDVIKIGGRYVLSPPNERMKKNMLDNGFVVDSEIRQKCDLFDTCEYEDYNDWLIFRK